MLVLSFVNQKGGCGKTTASVNLAGALAARGERVLLVDLDPQAHATMALGECAIGEASIAEILIDETPTTEAVREVPGGIHLLPSVPRLSEFEEIAERLIRPEQRLADALAPLEDRYDYAIVDCPPRADGALCANALRACDVAVLVVETGAFALQGALQALRVLDEVCENQARSFQVRALATLFDRRIKIARELLIAVQARFGQAMFETAIRNSVRLREAPAVGVPVQVLDPSSRASVDFAALAEEVVELEKHPEDPDTPGRLRFAGLSEAGDGASLG